MLGYSIVLTTEAHYGHLDRTVFSEEIHHVNLDHQHAHP